MKMYIRPNMLIGEVQKVFNDMFPFLRLEFYKNSADIKPRRKMSDLARIGDGQLVITDSDLEVSPDMRVKDLENAFKKLFTLTVEVFRRSGSTWLQTTITDDWTLEHQNNHGKEISEVTKYLKHNDITED